MEKARVKVTKSNFGDYIKFEEKIHSIAILTLLPMDLRSC